MEIDIFQIGRILEKNFPKLLEAGDPAIDLAIEDLARGKNQLEALIEEAQNLKPGDYEGLAQVIANLKGEFEHKRQHIDEALSPLDKLWVAAIEELNSQP